MTGSLRRVGGEECLCDYRHRDSSTRLERRAQNDIFGRSAVTLNGCRSLKVIHKPAMPKARRIPYREAPGGWWRTVSRGRPAGAVQPRAIEYVRLSGETGFGGHIRWGTDCHPAGCLPRASSGIILLGCASDVGERDWLECARVGRRPGRRRLPPQGGSGEEIRLLEFIRPRTSGLPRCVVWRGPCR